MLHRRYGKFQFTDIFPLWIGSFILVSIGLISLITDGNHSSKLLGLFIMLVSFAWIFLVLVRYNERFLLGEVSILVTKFFKANTIEIPKEYILIYAYADIHEKIGSQSYSLYNKHTVSIVRQMPLNDVLNRLHSYHTKRYSNSSIEEVFQQNFIYSFVVEGTLPHLLLERSAYCIIPESLYGKLKTDTHGLFVDMGY